MAPSSNLLWWRRRINNNSIVISLLLLLLLLMPSMLTSSPSSERAQEIMRFAPTLLLSSFCLLRDGPTGTYVMCTSGRQRRQELLTQGMPPVKKLLKDRHCIYVRISGTSREEIVWEERTLSRRIPLHSRLTSATVGKVRNKPAVGQSSWLLLRLSVWSAREAKMEGARASSLEST